MLLLLSLSALLLGPVYGQRPTVDIEDFDLTTSGYEFIFHDYYDLMLVVHRESCYTLQLEEQTEAYLLTQEQKRVAEDFLIWVVQMNKTHNLHESSITNMRSTFGDILADFHCMGKKVFNIIVGAPDFTRYGIIRGFITTTPTPTRPAPHPTAPRATTEQLAPAEQSFLDFLGLG